MSTDVGGCFFGVWVGWGGLIWIVVEDSFGQTHAWAYKASCYIHPYA